MTKQKLQRSRVKISKLEESTSKLNKKEQKKVKGGGIGDGSVKYISINIARVSDGTSNTIKDGSSNT